MKQRLLKAVLLLLSFFYTTVVAVLLIKGKHTHFQILTNVQLRGWLGWHVFKSFPCSVRGRLGEGCSHAVTLHASDWRSLRLLTVIDHCLRELASLSNSHYFLCFVPCFLSLSFSFFLFQALKAGSAQKNRLPTSPFILLTPALFLYHFEPLLFP